MKKYNNRNLVLGKYEMCKKCNVLMERRTHRFLTPKQQKQPYYYTEWDYCTLCKFVQHYDKYKVYLSKDFKQYAESKNEESNLLNLMKNF